MLQHESEGPSVPNAAAQARVTPDELNTALKALEDRQNSTVAIGSVVDELRLNATPEQIWEQVQKQRAQAAATRTPLTIYCKSHGFCKSFCKSVCQRRNQSNADASFTIAR